MKQSLLFLLISISSFCSAQGVRFQLYRTKACAVVEKLDTGYTLYKSITDTAIYPFKSGTLNLPGPGSYRISFNDGFYRDTTVVIRDTGLFIFHIKEPDFGLYEGGLDMPMVYRACDKLLNGFFESYYPDGKIKLRGNFKNGYVKDSMLTYYNNGALKYRRLHLLKITSIETFDSLAHRIKISTYQNGSIMVYRWSKAKEFFANGHLKFETSDINQIKKTREFYPNGHLKFKLTKRRRIEYYENGKEMVVYRWKRKFKLFERDEKGVHDYIVHKKEYDEDGRIIKLTVYEDWLRSGSPPQLDPEQSDWIVSMVEYKDGKHIELMKDVDMKDHHKD